ncbi:hypothetical protein [Pseudolactococcus piscium]|uniref:Uncharacterized protein n=1 Tax=Pseudolactococcus piscium MKFS47 TaxID=297352 RepID=A0A0D6E0B1_9LACT|nr:hypothetical protein [Lactococcus piscium]CEN29170.1 Uncharacterized protein LACPI_1970 [Lactococcus piscium MKFS47]
MPKSIKFGRNFEKTVKDGMRKAALNGTYDIKCPHCEQDISVKSGKSLCPKCNKEINLNLNIDF